MRICHCSRFGFPSKVIDSDPLSDEKLPLLDGQSSIQRFHNGTLFIFHSFNAGISGKSWTSIGIGYAGGSGRNCGIMGELQSGVKLFLLS